RRRAAPAAQVRAHVRAAARRARWCPRRAGVRARGDTGVPQVCRGLGRGPDAPTRTMRVGFFGAWDAGYPRNRILRDGLIGAGAAVADVRVRERRAVFRYPALAMAFRRAPHLDAVLVPAFRHKDVPLARLLAGRRPLVFDPLVSRWDTLVEDWALHAPGSAQA